MSKWIRWRKTWPQRRRSRFRFKRNSAQSSRNWHLLRSGKRNLLSSERRTTGCVPISKSYTRSTINWVFLHTTNFITLNKSSKTMHVLRSKSTSRVSTKFKLKLKKMKKLDRKLKSKKTNSPPKCKTSSLSTLKIFPWKSEMRKFPSWLRS